MTVVALVGSLREDSHNERLARAALAQLPAGTDSVLWDHIGELPFYDADLEDAVPAIVQELRDLVASAEALIVVTPEYNGSMSGVLKNAIDWLSRPRGSAALQDLPTVVLAATISPRAAQWAREDSVRILGVAGAQVLHHHGVGSMTDADFTADQLADLADLAQRVCRGRRDAA